MATNKENQGSKKRRSEHRSPSKITFSLDCPAATIGYQASGGGKEVVPTVQKTNTKIKSEGAVFYCDICEREFAKEDGLRMHIKTSKDHKNRVNMQKLSGHVQDPRLASQLTPRTVDSTAPHGACTQKTLETSTNGFNGVESYRLMDQGMMETAPLSRQAENARPFPRHRSTGLQIQAQRTGDSSHVSTYLPQPDQIPVEIGDNHSQKADHLKHSNLVPTVIPHFQYALELKSLSEHCHTSEDLRKHKYLLREYTDDDMVDFCRCENCGGLQKNLRTRNRPNCSFHSKKRQTRKDGQKVYPCCGELGPGCVSLPAHVYGDPDRDLVAKYRGFAFTPTSSSPHLKRRAVTLDCEMAGVIGGMNEVILLCAADYLTGETLINTLVSPTKQVVSWCTQFSGVTQSDMAMAEARRRTLKGWQEARREMWKHIDADTVLIGHALQHDLDVLGMIHTNVVDSAILAKKALGAEIYVRSWGLKLLCDELLGVEIQKQERKGHDCLEDALAAREVVLWCCRNPQELENWGKIKREEEDKKIEERKKAQEERLRKKEEKEKEKEKEKEYEERNEKKKEEREGVETTLHEPKSLLREAMIDDLADDKIHRTL